MRLNPFGKKPTVRPPEVGKVGNVEFEKIELVHLREVSATVQALDNQWVPQHILADLYRQGLHLYDPKLKARVEAAARVEYMRALVNAEQVFLNRACFYNNSALYRDYYQSGKDHQHDAELAQSRRDFKDLINEGTIVPWLLKEGSPDQRPIFGTDQFDQWTRICQEVRMKCLRLSWDDLSNATQLKNMSLRFDRLLKSAPDDFYSLFSEGTENQDVIRTAKDLGLDLNQLPTFLQRLRDVRNQINMQNEPWTREQLYKKFVVRDSTEPVYGHYDPGKSFSSQIKQLLDLRQITNASDFFDRYAFTPLDTLPRSALQELRLDTPQRSNEDITPDDILRIVRRNVFDMVAGGLYVRSMGELRLADIKRIRDTQAWHYYIKTMQELLRDPLQFSDRAQKVYKSYEAVAREISKMVAQERGDQFLQRWSPAITLVITVGSALLTVVWPSPDANMGKQVLYNMSANVGQNVAGVGARLLIRGMAQLGAQADLSASLDFMRKKSRDADGLWKEVQRRLKEQANFKEVSSEDLRNVIEDPNINFPEDI